ncbi:MAG: DUF5011 domain-containing protein [Lachnospiraceae bacterium]|nr:DUF5011 domain-containing protein [Lachnospiraceae bacterium]
MKIIFLEGARQSIIFKRNIVIVAVVIGMAAGFSRMQGIDYIRRPYIVQAEGNTEDEEKPVLRLSGKVKLTVEKGKEIRLPKTTAEDNIDGNITKKIKVVVKKGTKKYLKMARAVKRNKKIKFTSTGNYVITYTVSDTAGNKAERKRYIAVIRRQEKTSGKIP